MNRSGFRTFCRRAWPVLLAAAFLFAAATGAVGLLAGRGAETLLAAPGSTLPASAAFSLEGALWDGMILTALLAGAAFLLRERR